MTREELVRAVEEAVGLLGPRYRDAAKESDLYEAALLTVAVEAARRLGVEILITNNEAEQAGQVIFRQSPGNLWLGGFTYVLASFPSRGKAIEIHLGIYVPGASKVAHKCDVAVLDREEADRSRTLGVHPRRSGLIASIEAKHYVASPGLGVGRSFLGLSAELTHSKCSLVFPAEGSVNIKALLAGKPSECLTQS